MFRRERGGGGQGRTSPSTRAYHPRGLPAPQRLARDAQLLGAEVQAVEDARVLLLERVHERGERALDELLLRAVHGARKRLDQPHKGQPLRHTGGGVGMTPRVCFGLRRAAPIGRSPFAALPLHPFPPSAVVPIGLSPPCVLPLPPWPIRPSLLPLPATVCPQVAEFAVLFHKI